MDRVPAGARRPPATPPSTGSTRVSRTAADIAGIATERNPLAVDPLFELSAIEQARGRTDEAEARSSAPSSCSRPAQSVAAARPPAAVGAEHPEGALDAFQAAYYLDPKSPASTSDVLEAEPGGPAPTGAEPTP